MKFSMAFVNRYSDTRDSRLVHNLVAGMVPFATYPACLYHCRELPCPLISACKTVIAEISSFDVELTAE
jgi:hypothetical protein